MTVLEAFAAGCVPVCTEVASLDKSVFVDGENCRLCPVDRLEQMVDIWDSLTPETLARLSAGALRVGERFTAGHTYREYRDFVADLRRARPLQDWPAVPLPRLEGEWPIAEHNPWLHKSSPLRGALRKALDLLGLRARGER
jgi:hypothetical protein